MTASATTSMPSSRSSATRSTCCISTRPGTPTPTSTSSTTAITPSRPTCPARSPNAITFATHSTHKLLAALSQASMIHVQHGETQTLDMARFNEAFMMHTSTSPQYGIIASCDVAAAMMEQPAGRALVQETIDEALSFRRAMTAVKQQLKGSWWFDVWQPDAMAEQPTERATGDWVLKPGDRWHGFEGPGREPRAGRPDQGHDPHPGPRRRRRHAGARHSRGGGRQVPVVAADRDREDRPLFLPGAVLDGHHQGQVEHARHRALNFKDLYDANAPLKRVLPALVEAHPEAYAKMGLKDLCERDAPGLSRGQSAARRSRTCTRRCPRWRCGPPMPTSASCAGRVESVEIDKLMGRTLAVMVVPYPPGIPLIMPGERITAGDQVDPRLPALRARLRPQVPGLRDRHPRTALRAARGRQALSRGLRRTRRRTMIPRDV